MNSFGCSYCYVDKASCLYAGLSTVWTGRWASDRRSEYWTRLDRIGIGVLGEHLLPTHAHFYRNVKLVNNYQVFGIIERVFDSGME